MEDIIIVKNEAAIDNMKMKNLVNIEEHFA
jgi:hypothetical protein